MRPTFPETFMSIAHVLALRGTCPRLQVGAVIVSYDNQIIATGYNGAPRGMPHCGCVMEENHCVNAVHAELNCILQAAKLGTSINGSTLYVTHYPCTRCFIALKQAGVTQVVYDNIYENLGPRLEIPLGVRCQHILNIFL